MNDQQAEALRIARALINAGIPVFVAKQATDHTGEWRPDGGHGGCGYWLPPGWQKTRPDPGVVEQWRPGMALCAVMGHGLDLLDVDPRHGGDQTKAGLQSAGMWPTVYGHAHTPSGGTHDFIASLGIGSRDDVRPGLDVKAGTSTGEGRGFAFIAPTVRLSKTTGELTEYRWAEVPDLDMLATEGTDDDTGAGIADMVTKARGRTKAGKGDDQEEKPAGWFMRGPIAPGQRYNTLRAFAGWLRRVNTPRDLAEKMLHQRFEECEQGAEPFTWKEATDLLDDIYQRYQPRYRDVEDLIGDLNDQGTEQNRWEDPLPVGPPELPPFPVDRLGSTLAEWVRAQAASKNVAPTVATLSALGVISAAIGGRRRVEVRDDDDWFENVCLYVMALADSSERKTPALAAAEKPLVNAIGKLKDAQAEEIRFHNDQVEVAEGRYEKVKQQAKNDKATEADLKMAFDDWKKVGEPRHLPLAVIGGDSTPEYVVKTAAEQGERVAVLGSEAGFLTQLLGAYGVEAIMDFPLQAYSGAKYGSGRVGRGGIDMLKPAMTLGLIIQPDPIRGLSKKNPQIKGNGFVNRLLFGYAEQMPPAKFRSPRVPKEVAKAFDDRVVALIEHVWDTEKGADMSLTEDAADVFEQFHDDVHKRGKPGGDLHDLAAWSGKLPGQIIRVAACLTLFANHGAMEIEADTMADAVAMAPYLVAHARRAMADMDATTQGGHRPLLDILGWLKLHVKQGATVTVRQVWQGLKGRSWASDVETMKNAMAELEELGWIAEVPAEHVPGKRGRKPSPKFELHPWVHSSPEPRTSTPTEKASHKSHNHPKDRGDVDSGICGTEKQGGSVSGGHNFTAQTTTTACRTPGCTTRVALDLFPDGHCIDHQEAA